MMIMIFVVFQQQGKQNIPPPWLIAMQRYGPPPSYPNLKIPGLNAPIPEVCLLLGFYCNQFVNNNTKVCSKIIQLRCFHSMAYNYFVFVKL